MLLEVCDRGRQKENRSVAMAARRLGTGKMDSPLSSIFWVPDGRARKKVQALGLRFNIHPLASFDTGTDGRSERMLGLGLSFTL